MFYQFASIALSSLEACGNLPAMHMYYRTLRLAHHERNPACKATRIVNGTTSCDRITVVD